MRIQWSSNICLNSMLCSSHQFIVLVYILDRKKKVLFCSLSLPLPLLICPSLLRPAIVFPTLQRWWGSDGARFYPCIMGQGRDGFRLFKPTSPRLASPCPSSPRPLSTLIKVIIISFSYPKILLFKQTYQY